MYAAPRGLTLLMILTAMERKGATAFKCNKDGNQYHSIEFKIKGEYKPISVEEVRRLAT